MRAPTAWICLAATVVLEVLATLSLRASDGFTDPVPSIVAICAYAATVVVLSLALKTIPMSVAYIVWTGAGTSGVVLLGVIIFGDALTPLSWLGVLLVIGGVGMINARRSPGGEESRAEEEHPQRP